MNTENNGAFKSKEDIKRAIAEIDAAISKLNQKFTDVQVIEPKKDLISASTKGKLIITAFLICFPCLQCFFLRMRTLPHRPIPPKTE